MLFRSDHVAALEDVPADERRALEEDLGQLADGRLRVELRVGDLLWKRGNLRVDGHLRQDVDVLVEVGLAARHGRLLLVVAARHFHLVATGHVAAFRRLGVHRDQHRDSGNASDRKESEVHKVLRLAGVNAKTVPRGRAPVSACFCGLSPTLVGFSTNVRKIPRMMRSCREATTCLLVCAERFSVVCVVGS